MSDDGDEDSDISNYNKKKRRFCQMTAIQIQFSIRKLKSLTSQRR